MAALQLDHSELWRQIPPEEKFAIMARAHSKGVLASLVTIAVGATIAIGLQLSELMWASFLLCPLVFQFAAGKAWRDLRPRVMLEYLAARSAARRYAFTANAKELDLTMMFRGHLEHQFGEGEEATQEALEAMVANAKDAEVWVALFNDALVMMSEELGGATAQFAHVINEKMKVESRTLDERGDYSNAKELTIWGSKGKRFDTQVIKLTSHQPAALIVFEKKLRQLIEVNANNKDKDADVDAIPESSGSRYDFPVD